MAGTPLASAFVRIRPDTSDFRRDAERDIGAAGRQAGSRFGEEFGDGLNRSGAGEEAGEQTGRRFGGAFADSLKIAAGVAIAAVGEQAATALSAGFTAALDVGAARSKLQAQLGLTADESKRIGGVAGKLFAGAYGENIQEVNAAVTSVIQNMDGMRGASSAALETMTARAITTGQVLDEDVSSVTKAVSQLMRTGLAPNAEVAFDVITKGAQQGVNASGDLLDTFTEYGTQFRKFGFDAAQATGLLSQGLKGGARDADVVADAIKEFSIRAIDGSKGTADGFKALGLSGKTMAADIAAGGPRANKALDTTLDRLRAVKDPTDQAAIAVALFGTQSEDLGKALFKLDPSTATKALGDMAGATDKASAALGDNAAARFESFKRTMTTNVVTVVADRVIPVLENLSQAFTNVGGSGGGLAAAAVPLVGIGIAAKVGAVAVGAVRTGIGGIVTAGRGIGAAAAGVGRFTSGFRSADAASSAFSGRLGTIGGKARTAFNAAAAGARAATTATLSAASAATTASVAWARNAAATALSTARTIAAAAVQKTVAAATKAWAVAQLALNLVMSANPIALVVIGIAALIAIVVTAYKRSETFKRIVDAAFRGVAIAGKWMWDKVLKPVFNFLGKGFVLLGQGAKVYLNIAKSVWSGVSGAVGAGWNKISGFFNRIKQGMSLVGKAFGTGASAIRTAWARVQEYTKKPINFVIGTVYNRGIVGLWNKVMGWLHLPGSMKLNTLPQLAAGGPMPVRPGVFNKPTAVVGEGNPNYPEYVIPTDPKYRGRAQALWQAAGGNLQMLQLGGVIGSVKKFASKAVNIGKSALELITDPGKVWDRLVKQFVPSSEGLRDSPWGTAAAEIPKLVLNKARTYALSVFKAFGSSFGGDGSGVVKAALKYIGQGDDRGVDNNNRFTREWGWPSGTPWCALFASTAIRDAKATKKYPGYPTAAVAGYNSAMRHVGLGEGRPGDLATYGGSSHINIIVKKASGGYDTVGGNQGPVVNRYVRGGQSAILRPLAAGGSITAAKTSVAQQRRVFAQRNLDPNDARNPMLGQLRKERRPLFDDGGFGVGWPFHSTKPEAVFTQRQFQDIRALATRGGGNTYNINMHGVASIPTEKQMINAIERSTTMYGKW